MARRNRDAEVGADMWTGGGGGEGRMSREIGMDVCALPRVKQIAVGACLSGTGSAQYSVVTLEGWDGGGGIGREVRGGRGYRYTHS